MLFRSFTGAGAAARGFSSIAEAALRAGAVPGRLAGLFVGVAIVVGPFAGAALLLLPVFATICIPFSVLLGACPGDSCGARGFLPSPHG